MEDKDIHEIIVSPRKLTFVRYGYQGEEFYISFTSKGLEPLKELIGVYEAYTKTSKKLRSLIEKDETLLRRIKSIIRRTFVSLAFMTGKVVAPFDEIKTYIIERKKGLENLVVKERPIVVTIVCTYPFVSIPIREEFIDIAKELMLKMRYL